MSSLYKSIILGIALVYFFISGNASANIHASANINFTNIKLIDLSPNDEITPSISYMTIYSESESRLTNYAVGDMFSVLNDRSSKNLLPIGTDATQFGLDLAAKARFSGGGFGSLSTSMYINNVTADILAYERLDTIFRLTPNTKITFSGKINVSTYTTGFSSSTQYANGFGDINISQSNSLDMFYRIAQSDTRTNIGNVSENFTYSIENNSATPIVAWMYLRSYNSGVNSAPIPEPDTWAMLAIGFLFISFTGKRKKSVL